MDLEFAADSEILDTQDSNIMNSGAYANSLNVSLLPT